MAIIDQEYRVPADVNPDWKIAIIHSIYYEELISKIVSSANRALLNAGINPESISMHAVGGSFEIPVIGAALAKQKKADAILGFGIIVQGDTTHAQHVSREVSRGIMDIQVEYQIPFSHGVMHVDSIEQAEDRVNRGFECACHALQSLAELARLKS